MTKGVFVVALSGLMLGSCTSGFEGFNTDPDSAQDIDQKTLITTMEMDAVIPCSDEGANAYQRACNLMGDSYSGYMAAISSFDNGGVNTTTYALDATDYNNVPFSVAFTDVMAAWLTLRYAYEAEQISEDTFAIAEVIKVFALQRATDIYGPLPVTHFGETENPYDSQETVYMSLFEDLNAAIAVLKEYATNSPDATPLSSVDIIYQGSYPKWLRLANSLKLRMAIRISGVDAEYAKQQALSAINHPIGVMTSNSDSAYDNLNGRYPNGFYQVGHGWGEARVNASITAYMNGYEDPRREKYFTKVTVAGTEGYIGVRSGIQGANKADFAEYSEWNVTSTTPMPFFVAAEVAFLRAEGALLGWDMGGTAQHWYEEGIRLAFSEVGASGADDYIANSSATPGNYVDPKNSAYNYNNRSTIPIAWDAVSSDEQHLEQIITQKWIANFPNGLEAWCDFRRTGYPYIFPAYNNLSTQGVTNDRQQRRLRFSLSEYQTNNANVTAAVSMLSNGQDSDNTDLWWAKKN